MVGQTASDHKILEYLGSGEMDLVFRSRAAIFGPSCQQLPKPG